MINTEDFYRFLVRNHIDFFTGVPDSLLESICHCIHTNTDSNKHIIAANEGNAIALAVGYYLSSKKTPFVYMQNSGFGNAINPLLSLASGDVYSIPMIIFVGWRGEPGSKDEPQHKLQGQIMSDLLRACRIKNDVLPQNIKDAQDKIIKAIDIVKSNLEPFVFLVKKDTFTHYSSILRRDNIYSLSRQDAIKIICNQLSDDDIVLGSTGKISREIYQHRVKLYHSSKMDWLNVGAMGHVSQIALLVAMNNPSRRVICLDGDGSILMHLGGLSILASKKTKNLKHFVLNNGCHESVGGQPTVGFDIDIVSLSKSVGYEFSQRLSSEKEVLLHINDILNNDLLSLTEVRVANQSNKNLMRPNNDFMKHRNSFINYNLNYKYNLKREVIGNGVLDELDRMIAFYNARNIFIITGQASFDKNFKHRFRSIEKKYNVSFFNDFCSNFDDKILLKAIDKFNSASYDIIIAIGGGTVMDMAKMIRVFFNKHISISELLDKKTSKSLVNKHKLIVIPTTSGSGSENTQFSVLYKNNTKYSIEHESMIPDHVILDHNLKYHVNKKNAISSGLDAFCQSIESLWSINSTKESRAHAIYAIKLCLKYLVKSINTDDNVAKDKMSLSSFFAGKAINISKTTIAHALSYSITKNYNIPHGMSVASTIIELMKHNLVLNSKSKLLDTRGWEYYNNIISIFFEIFNASNIEEICDTMGSIFSKLEFYKYVACDIDINLIAESTNKSRFKNNPLYVNDGVLKLILQNSFGFK